MTSLESPAAISGTTPKGDAKSTKRQETAATVVSDATGEDDDPRSDEEFLAEGTRRCKDDALLPGVRLLRKVKDTSLFKDEHNEFFRRAEIMEQLRADLTAPASDGWTKQGESHGNRDFVTYYKIEDGGKLKCRIESVIEASLYVPFLATMNETGLYETWFPKWTFPFRLGLERSVKLKQVGRCEQVVQLTMALPFPLNKREIVFWGFAEEDCEANRDSAAYLLTVDETFQDGVVPPPERGVVRMDLESQFMFMPCPDDHVALKKSKGKYPEGEELILLTFVLYVDPKIPFVPHAFMNFATRTAIGTVWRMVLRISEEVREGKRPEHAELIASKGDEIYDWMEERAALISGWNPKKPETTEDA